MSDNELCVNGVSHQAKRLKMVEIYGGKDPEWKGWHNLLLLPSDKEGDHKCIAGPIDPETSLELITSIKAIGQN